MRLIRDFCLDEMLRWCCS